MGQIKFHVEAVDEESVHARDQGGSSKSLNLCVDTIFMYSVKPHWTLTSIYLPSVLYLSLI